MPESREAATATPPNVLPAVSAPPNVLPAVSAPPNVLPAVSAPPKKVAAAEPEPPAPPPLPSVIVQPQLPVMRRSERTVRARAVVSPSRARVVRLDAKTIGGAAAGGALLLVMGYWLGSLGRNTTTSTASTDAIDAKRALAAPTASSLAPSAERAERKAESAPVREPASAPVREVAPARPIGESPAEMAAVRQAEGKPREPEERAIAQASKVEARRAGSSSAAKAVAAATPEDRINSPLVAVPTRKPEETGVRPHATSTAGNGLISPVRDPGF